MDYFCLNGAEKKIDFLYDELDGTNLIMVFTIDKQENAVLG